MLAKIIFTILGVAIIFDCILFITILKKKDNGWQGVLFLHMIIGSALWNSIILTHILSEQSYLVPFIYMSAVYYVVSRYLFIQEYTGTRTIFSTNTIIALGLFFGILSLFPNTVVGNVTIHEQGYVVVENGRASVLFSLFILYATFYPIIILHRYFRSHRNGPTLIIYVGLIFYAIATILSNLILPIFFDIYYFNTIGPAFSTIFALFVFYAIFRYQFLHIKILVQRGIIFSVLFGVIVSIYALLMSGMTRSIHAISPTIQYVVVSLFVLACVFTIPLIEQWIRAKTDTFLFQKKYDYDTVARTLANIFAQNTGAESIIKISVRFLKKILHVPKIAYIQKHKLPKKLTRSGISFPITGSNNVSGYLWVAPKRSRDPFRETDTQLLSLYATMLGISLEKAKLLEKLEEKVAERTRELKQLRELEQTRYSALAHDLKTPLTVMTATYDMLAQEKVSHDTISILGKNINKVVRAVHDIMYLTNIGGQYENYEEVDLVTLSQNIAEYVSAICEMENVTFTTSIGRICTIRGNARDLEIMINNILGNAVRYTKMKPDAHISFTTKTTGTCCVIEVSDNGIGIPRDEIPMLFERNYRGSNTTNIEGDGIGLSVVKKIADAHGATIAIASTEGTGTTVTITFQKRVSCSL